ncbi:metallophosphoesterase [Halomonas sp. A40-4]|uniref:metallophosphoesterase n=1 Tax=Halomonas sp. A40-4 TaxID=2785909 RepID=UPI0018F04041|nr:metallophosphoesterase [Halomonas sp. A40-4]QPL44831.1 metallophosphoesterase [Halomonas sp. A40-4]
MRLVQITDAHLYADKQARSRAGVPWHHLKRVLQAVIAERPDFVVLTGDVSQDETATSYALASEAMSQLPCPWAWMAGNHDQPALMQAEHPLVDEVSLPPWRLLLLHTPVEGEPYGELGRDALATLSSKLEGDRRPTLIAMHHPPVEVGATWMDAIGLQDRDAFWEVISAFPQVKVILFGHAHQTYTQRHVAGTHDVAVYGCPAIADQFMPGAEHFMIDEASRPGYRIVDFHDQQWETRVERVTV